MNKVKKELIDELLDKLRLIWTYPYPKRKEQNKIIGECCDIYHELQKQVNGEGFHEFYDLADIAARTELTNEQYYEMLKICGVEVAQ